MDGWMDGWMMDRWIDGLYLLLFIIKFKDLFTNGLSMNTI